MTYRFNNIVDSREGKKGCGCIWARGVIPRGGLYYYLSISKSTSREQ